MSWMTDYAYWLQKNPQFEDSKTLMAAFEAGFKAGGETAYDDGYQNGYDEGYGDGFLEGRDES